MHITKQIETILIFLIIKCYSTRLNQNVKSKRIIDGRLSPPGLHTFVASISVHEYHRCGGTIVSKSYILTAAHCCYDKDENVLKESKITVSLGSVYWEEGKIRNVTKIIIHPLFDRKLKKNDISLLRIDKIRLKKKEISTIKLYPSRIDRNIDEENLLKATVIGWGLFNDGSSLGDTPSNRLRYVDVYIVPEYYCKMIYYKFHNTNLCVSSEDMRGSCSGDSGGPLVIKRRNKFYQIGLVSYGGDCNNTQPEVYTKLFDYIDWIKDIISIKS
nr:chymotrypsin-1-like [Onthophagus taurus]